MGDIFSKWEMLTLVEMKSVVQKRFLVFFSLVPHVERTTPKLMTVVPHSSFFGDWIQRTWNHSCFQSQPLAWGWRGLKTMFQDLTQIGNINDGTSHRASDPAWLGACPHCLPDDHPYIERHSAAPKPTCLDPHEPLKGGTVHFPHR